MTRGLEILRRELDITMALTGVTDARNVARRILVDRSQGEANLGRCLRRTLITRADACTMRRRVVCDVDARADRCAGVLASCSRD